MSITIPLLKANQIECRIGTISEKGLSLLLYKDARVDQQILDEQFGIFGWKRSHTCINGSIFCTVEVYDPDKGEWIGKQDVGTAGQMEKEKSSASDSFKRSCVNFGIGRELYSAPFIWCSSGNVEIQKRGDRFYCNERFSVNSIEYDDNREICGLTIVNGKGQCVYQYQQNRKSQKEDILTSDQKKAFYSELQRTGIPKTEVYRRYKIRDENEITQPLFSKMMAALSKTRSADTAA